MAIEVYPGDIPTVDKDGTNSVAPTTAIQDDGYPTSSEPPSSEHNFIFNRLLRAALSQRQKPVKDWLTATAYEEFELVINPDTPRKLYQANVAHTSTGTTLKENDLANWDIISESLDDLLGPFVDGDMVVGDTSSGNVIKSTIDAEVASRVKNDPGIVNGNLDIWQQDLPATPTPSGAELADLFQYSKVGPQVHNIIRGVGVPDGQGAEFISQFSIDMTVTTINSALDADENTVISYRMEGFDLAKYFGKTFTMSFWVIGNNTGTYSVAFANAANNRSYVAQYTINVADEWELKTITVVHDGVGVWNTDQNEGMDIKFVFAAGANFEASAANQWEAVDNLVVAGQTNFDATISNNIKISQINFNHGSVFRANLRTPNEELIRVRRYFIRWSVMEIGFRKHDNTDEMRFPFPFPVEMRITPTVTYSVNVKAGAISDPQTIGVNATNLNIQFVSTGGADENVIVNFETFISARFF